MMMPDEICRYLREAVTAIRAVRKGESRDYLGEIHAQACESGAKEIEKLSDMLAADLQIEDYVKVKQERAEALSKLDRYRTALEEISQQRLIAEMSDAGMDPDEADYEGGYEGCVERARGALSDE